MTQSTDVNLPRDLEPVWPDRCVCCGKQRPGGNLRLWTHSIGWSTLFFWHFGTLYFVKVPACAPCGRRLRATRVGKSLLFGAVALAGVALATWVLASHRGPMKKWLVTLVALACASPLVLRDVFFPPPIDITCFADTVDFEFRDPDYAAEFESLNRGAAPDGADT